MNYQSFVFLCWTQGIDPAVIQSHRDLVHYILIGLNSPKRSPEATLGYAELANITTIEQGFREIIKIIKYHTLDFDVWGRSLEKKNIQRLIRKPNKHIARIISKTFYLVGGITQ